MAAYSGAREAVRNLNPVSPRRGSRQHLKRTHAARSHSAKVQRKHVSRHVNLHTWLRKRGTAGWAVRVATLFNEEWCGRLTLWPQQPSGLTRASSLAMMITADIAIVYCQVMVGSSFDVCVCCII